MHRWTILRLEWRHEMPGICAAADTAAEAKRTTPHFPSPSGLPCSRCSKQPIPRLFVSLERDELLRQRNFLTRRRRSLPRNRSMRLRYVTANLLLEPSFYGPPLSSPLAYVALFFITFFIEFASIQ